MTNYVRKMLIAAEEAGLEFCVSHDGDTDYRGYSAAAAEDAIVACDEMDVTLRDADKKPVGWAMIINGLEEDERIADTAGDWMNTWWDANVGASL